ncbi:F0F1 ATP synthase subunit alpha [Sinirhodobacter ferrireducens]|uniref:ATP synthase subunit alpha n=1 Tax=Paenirhodobacter ferrireducens TaxID=1215032 RepID=A0A443LDQ4_9RHOB|nr:F0F1 ATP synthase subunit alpha [Sinirhodobacter ferrireducens]RWR47304.1 F0F1 ATP synthase subunit alpha [Sinirhodobacter ferrireducens]
MSDAPLDGLKAKVATAELGPEAEEIGTVTHIADGLADISGLPDAQFGEILIFDTGARGFVQMLDTESVKAAFLDPMTGVEAGSVVRRSGQLLSVPVGKGLLGRVVDPLGRPLDGLGPIVAEAMMETERPAPEIIERDFVAEPVETGILVVDALFAVGRGQRELIIGERQTGKTSIAIDAIVNQKRSDIISVYVAIGQRSTAVRRVIEAVREKGAFERTIFVVAPATAEPGLRWLAPFAATTMAEWVRDSGGHALIVYDDLTKHAAVHRELALLSRQPPGREAYPGDIFYLHSRLLERSAKLSKEKGSGSLTALPIAEIEAGNLSAYIPTNLISIADGQIVTSAALFAGNQRPAVDIGLSVSRVGGKAQWGALKAVSGRVRLDYAQYLEMKMFSRFGGFGDAAMKARLARGERIGALLTQPRFEPLSTPAQVALLAALDAGGLDTIEPGQIAAVKQALEPLIAAEPRLAAFRESPAKLDDELRAVLVACVKSAVGRITGGAT